MGKKRNQLIIDADENDRQITRALPKRNVSKSKNSKSKSSGKPPGESSKKAFVKKAIFLENNLLPM